MPKAKTKAMPSLLPCPFCGSDADYQVSPAIDHKERAHEFVRGYCLKCGASRGVIVAVKDRSPGRELRAAVEVWNQRVAPAEAKLPSKSPKSRAKRAK
ncbi:MAG: Lar family restriction alleviation protein [Xanthobacteraceae bacterium]